MNYSIIVYGFMLVLSSVVFSIAIYFMRRRERDALKLQQVIGFHVLTKLRALLTNVQQHRGLSNGLLNGDSNLTHRLMQQTALVNNNIKYINQQCKSTVLDEKSQPLSRWLSIIEHWPRLSQNVCKLTPANNLQQHNKLVLNILYFIDDITEQHQIYKIADTQGASMRHDWLELLFIAENIGQIRAIGTGVAAGKVCTSVERIRLNYLCNSLHQSIEDSSLLANTTPLIKLLQTVTEQITIPEPDIETETFFNIASECIEIVFNEFDIISQRFESVVKPQKSRLIQQDRYFRGT